MKRREGFTRIHPGLLPLPTVTGIASPSPASAVIGQAQALDADALRQAAHLPYLLFEFTFHFSVKQGFTGFGPPGDTAPRIVALQKRLAVIASGAEKAGLEYELGTLYQEAQSEEEARTAFARAVSEYRTLARSAPPKGMTLSWFGEALFAADKTEEAEGVLRAVVKGNPKDASAWDALGYVLLSRAFASLWPRSTGATGEFQASSDRDFQVAVSRLLITKPSPGIVSQAERLAAEASRCFERAIEAAPKASASYVARAGFRLLGDGYLRLVLRYLRGGDAGQKAAPGQSDGGAAGIVLKAVLSDAVLSDLWQAARRDAGDPHLLGLAALMELSRNAPNLRQLPPGSRAVWSALNDDARARIKEALTNLDSLKRRQDERVAARAWAIAGALRYTIGDADAEAELREAVRKNSASLLSWDMLTGLLIGRGRFAELTALYEERITREDSARSRVILAKFYDRLNQPEKVEAHVRSALRQALEDPLANLAMAALLLRSEKGGERIKAVEPLARLERLQKSGKLSTDLESQYLVLRGVSLALSGDTRAARRELERALFLDRNNVEARQALAALPSDTVI